MIYYVPTLILYNFMKSCPEGHHGSHSWFTIVVDNNKLVPVYPIQLKQFKYDDNKDECAIGTIMKEFVMNNYIK